MRSARTGRTKIIALLAVLGASSLVLACSALLDLSPPPQGIGDDGGTPDGEGGPGDCSTHYVSAATGSDGNDGCTVDHPFKSITGALAAVNAGAQGYSIKIASGTYTEDNLTITLPGTLSGSWDPTFTTQSGASTAGGSLVRIGTPSLENKQTLTISPKVAAGLTPLTTTVTGLKVVGATVANSYAVRVTATVTPVFLSGNDLVGADIVGSRALSVLSATPEVTKNTIQSGTAEDTAGAELLSADMTVGPTGYFHGNTVIGGNALSGDDLTPLSSTGLVIGHVVATEAAGNPVTGNTIHTGATYGTTPTAYGVSITNSIVDVTANYIYSAGQPLPGESTSGIAGVFAGVGTTARIAGNRIASGGANGYGDFAGVKAIGGDNVVIVNNMIYAGQNVPQGDRAGVSIGIFVNMIPGYVLIADNSIYTGFPGGTKSAFGIYTGSSQTGAVVQDNIIAGSGDSDWAIKVSECDGGISTLESNVFIGEGDGVFNAADCRGLNDAGLPSVHDVGGIAKYVPTTTGNLIVTSTCTAEDQTAGACIVNAACTGANPSDPCVAAIWSNFGTDHGATAFNDAWHLVPNVACQIAQGGVPVDAGIEGGALVRDYYGVTRDPNTPTIGASELGPDAGPCTP